MRPGSKFHFVSVLYGTQHAQIYTTVCIFNIYGGGICRKISKLQYTAPAAAKNIAYAYAFIGFPNEVGDIVVVLVFGRVERKVFSKPPKLPVFARKNRVSRVRAIAIVYLFGRGRVGSRTLHFEPLDTQHGR